jgi:hypothetical protein
MVSECSLNQQSTAARRALTISYSLPFCIRGVCIDDSDRLHTYDCVSFKLQPVLLVESAANKCLNVVSVLEYNTDVAIFKFYCIYFFATNDRFSCKEG